MNDKKKFGQSFMMKKDFVFRINEGIYNNSLFLRLSLYELSSTNEVINAKRII